LRRFIGVADIASVRFSLPAQLLEPRPNLEYWNYLDRPEMFIAIGDPEEPLERMLGILRFWFTKDLKYVKGKPCKPYNSALGEFFRVCLCRASAETSALILYLQCNWDVTEAAPPIPSIRPKTGTSSAASSIKSSKASGLSRTPSATTLPITTKLEKPIRVSYLTEQTSHHPPVSAFYVDCPEKGISARGFDQLSAKFTGTSIKVTAGEHNLGIFITLHKRDDEQYQLTHPAAHLGGLLRGSLSVTVGDQCFVTCPKTKLKTILHYQEEGWLGKTQNKVEGVIFHYDPENDDKVRIRDVLENDIVARLEGNWRERTYFSLGPKPIVSPLALAPPLFHHSQPSGPSKPNSPHRPHSPLRPPEDNPSGITTTGKRIPPLLVWRHVCHPLETILQSHDCQARDGRKPARKGENKAGERRGMETLVFQGQYYPLGQAGVDRRGTGRPAGTAGGEVGTGYEGGAWCVVTGLYV